MEQEIIEYVMTIGSLIEKAISRIPPTKKADFLTSIGYNYGEIVSTEEAYYILQKMPAELCISILAETGNHLKLNKALQKQEPSAFVELCENTNNISYVLYACALYRDLDENYTRVRKDINATCDIDKLTKLSFAVNGRPFSTYKESICEFLEKFGECLPEFTKPSFMSKDEAMDLLVCILKLRSYPEYYLSILSGLIKVDKDLKEFRPIVLGVCGEELIEKKYILAQVPEEEWYLPKNVFGIQTVAFDSFEPSEECKKFINEHPENFENLINEAAKKGVIDDLPLVKKTFVQIILGRDLGCEAYIKLPINYTPFVYAIIRQMCDSKGYVKIPKFFYCALSKYGKEYDPDNGTGIANGCKEEYKRMIETYIPPAKFVVKE